MKCPMREQTTYEFSNVLVEGKPVIKSVKEEYPECYGEECPFHSTWEAGGCALVAKAISRCCED